MKRSEIERMLLDPEGARTLAEAAAVLRRSVGFDGTVSSQSSEIRSTGPTPFAIRATAKDTEATDLHNVSRRSLRANIGRFLPEFADETPPRVLELVIERYRRQPTEVNEYLVQDAISRLTCAGELDAEAQQLVRGALDTLTSVPLSYQDADEDKDSIWSFLYEHSDFKGRSVLGYLGPSSIYSSLRKTSLKNVDLNDRISSLTLDASPGEDRGDCYLFQHDRFLGRFIGIRTNANEPTSEVSVSYVGDSINDRTSSVLLVRRHSSETVRALGDPITKALIGDIVADVKKVESLRGDPIFTWDMWPTGGAYHPNDPDKRFVQVKIPVEIEVNNWFNYDAEIWLWFYLYIAEPLVPVFGGGGDLRGHLAYYGAWVEGGVISENVKDGIMEALPQKFGDIDSLLDSLLATVNTAGPYKMVYLLPGDQTAFNGAQYLQGHVEDNVSVVLAKTTQPVLTTSSVNSF